jgi:DNA-binding GntR family transcriptional regulator
VEHGLDPRAANGEPGYVPRAQDVAQWVREAIYGGRFKAGQPIRQEAVARDLGVSRTPVREALRQLEAEGLVVIRPHSGARVSWLDYEECEESYKIRERLEPLALGESIGRLGGDELAEAVGLAAAIEACRGDEQAWLDADRALHLAFYAGVRSERVFGMVMDFWDATVRFQRLLLTLFSDEDYALEESEHRLILDALETGNTRAGEALVRAHIERARLRLSHNRSLFTG